MMGEQDGMGNEITDGQVDDWLERASHRTATTGMVAEGIRIVERLIKENGHLRHTLKASVEANAMYEVLEQTYLELLQAGKDWMYGTDPSGACGGCGDCSTCTLATMIDHAETKERDVDNGRDIHMRRMLQARTGAAHDTKRDHQTG